MTVIEKSSEKRATRASALAYAAFVAVVLIAIGYVGRTTLPQPAALRQHADLAQAKPKAAKNRVSPSAAPLTAEMEELEKSFDTDEGRQTMAAILNLSGRLCANVKDVHPLRSAGTYEIVCVAYRGGRGEKIYLLDLRSGFVKIEDF